MISDARRDASNIISEAFKKFSDQHHQHQQTIEKDLQVSLFEDNISRFQAQIRACREERNSLVMMGDSAGRIEVIDDSILRLDADIRRDREEMIVYIESLGRTLRILEIEKELNSLNREIDKSEKQVRDAKANVENFTPVTSLLDDNDENCNKQSDDEFDILSNELDQSTDKLDSLKQQRRELLVSKEVLINTPCENSEIICYGGLNAFSLVPGSLTTLRFNSHQRIDIADHL